MSEEKITQEDVEQSFRSSLEDAIVVVEKISPYCESVSDLLEMLKLATQNAAQLRFLMDRVIPKRK